MDSHIFVLWRLGPTIPPPPCATTRPWCSTASLCNTAFTGSLCNTASLCNSCHRLLMIEKPEAAVKLLVSKTPTDDELSHRDLAFPHLLRPSTERDRPHPAARPTFRNPARHPQGAAMGSDGLPWTWSPWFPTTGNRIAPRGYTVPRCRKPRTPSPRKTVTPSHSKLFSTFWVQ